MAKTHELRKDFIDELSKMNQNELNEFIKKKGKPPKLVQMVEFVKKTDSKLL